MSERQQLAARIDELCASVEAQAIRVRRHMHRFPEIGWHEHRTAAYLDKWLRQHGLEPSRMLETGLVVDIGSGESPVIYRADIDALPIQDAKQPGRATAVSEVPGACHACGHDVHTAIAAGVAAVFGQLAEDLPGPVRVVFQPAEEPLPSGAAAMLREGVADGVRAALALHCDPARDTGHVGVRDGVLTSTSDLVDIELIGQSCHAARPHLGRDAIAAAAEVVQALHRLVGQRVNPLEPAVICVSRIQGGTADNVVAERAAISANLRTFHPETRERLHRALRLITEKAAALHRCTAEISFRMGSPPAVNDPRLHRVVSLAAAEVLGEQAVRTLAVPSTGAEDFGQFSAIVPTYMMRLGVRPPGGATLNLHTPSFDVDERAIGVAMRVMARAVLDAFSAIGPLGSEEWAPGPGSPDPTPGNGSA